MRRVKSNVSHRIRRQPSVFSVRWFRIALGVGVALVLALLVGPSVASWFGGDLPRSLFLLAPWGGSEKTARSATPEASAPRPSASSPAPPSSSSPSSSGATGSSGSAGASGSSRGTASATSKVPTAPAESAPPRKAASPPAPASPSPPAATAAPKKTAPESGGTTPPVDGATAQSGSLSAPPSVYWVQVGAFLDHKNADRLAERLKGDGLSAATTSFEQSRVLYRVLLTSGDGGRVTDDAVERVRKLGHPVEPTADGPAVTGLVPLRKAVETSHTLKQQGISVRLKQEVSSSTFRVVRVGSFATVAEADAALAALNAKGVEGVVVQER